MCIRDSLYTFYSSWGDGIDARSDYAFPRYDRPFSHTGGFIWKSVWVRNVWFQYWGNSCPANLWLDIRSIRAILFIFWHRWNYDLLNVDSLYLGAPPRQLVLLLVFPSCCSRDHTYRPLAIIMAVPSHVQPSGATSNTRRPYIVAHII